MTIIKYVNNLEIEETSDIELINKILFLMIVIPTMIMILSIFDARPTEFIYCNFDGLRHPVEYSNTYKYIFINFYSYLIPLFIAIIFPHEVKKCKIKNGILWESIECIYDESFNRIFYSVFYYPLYLWVVKNIIFFYYLYPYYCSNIRTRPIEYNDSMRSYLNRRLYSGSRVMSFGSNLYDRTDSNNSINYNQNEYVYQINNNNNINYMDSVECTICYTKKEMGWKCCNTRCGKVLCKDCLNSMLDTDPDHLRLRCPYCREYHIIIV